jgi:hypothetical protein
MGLFDRFRRRLIHDPAGLATFIDDYALVLAETIVQDYTRQRAGNDADALFADQVFRVVLDKARWEGYPRTLAMGGALVETKLRAHAGARAHAVTFGLTAHVLEAFDRRTIPPAIGEVDWRAARAELERSLNELVHQRPKTIDMAVQEHSSYFLAIMPLHQKLRGDDFPALCDRLKAMLSQFEEAVVHHANLAALSEQLAARAEQTPAKAD